MSPCQMQALLAFFLLIFSKVYSNSQINDDAHRCATSYGKVSLTDSADAQVRRPAILLAFQGAGSAYVRTLVEFATGRLTGSTNSGDNELRFSMVGEKTCSLRNSIIDSNPKDVGFNDDGLLEPLNGRSRKKCSKGDVYDFSRAIILTRDPFESLFSQFKRKQTGASESIITTTALQTVKLAWERSAIDSSAEYAERWRNLMEPVLKKFSSGNLTQLRFEDFINKDRQMGTLEKTIKFLSYPVTADRIGCAFKLAEGPSTKASRSASSSSGSGGSGSEESSRSSGEADAKYAMSQLSGEAACAVWKNVEPYSKHFGYTPPWGNSGSCQSYGKNYASVARPASSINDVNATQRAFDEKRRQCDAKYGQLRFLTDAEHQGRTPPVLMSFPGSGNTWTRLLLEYATGVYTGSIDISDHELLAAFPGESYCSPNISIIKAHPADILLNEDRESIGFNLKADNEKANRRLAGQKEKCYNGTVTEFRRVVFISRDPYPSIFSDFQRDFTKSHIKAIGQPGTKTISVKKWRYHAEGLSRNYNAKWQDLVGPVLKTFGDRVMWITYEDLMNKNTRIAAVRKVTNFLGYNVTRDRLDCAFYLAEKPEVSHRKARIRAEDAYRLAGVLVCMLWKKIAGYSMYFGYTAWRNATCPYEPCEHVHTEMGYKPYNRSSRVIPPLFLPPKGPQIEVPGTWPTPPLLLSLRGSGEHVVVTLIEQASGLYAGYIGSQDRCRTRTSVLVAYPDELQLTSSSPSSTSSTSTTTSSSKVDLAIAISSNVAKERCAKGGVPSHLADSSSSSSGGGNIIIVTRHPIEIVRSEAHRNVSINRHSRADGKASLAWLEAALRASATVGNHWRDMLEPLYKEYPKERLRVVKLEDYYYATAATAATVAATEADSKNGKSRTSSLEQLLQFTLGSGDISLIQKTRVRCGYYRADRDGLLSGSALAVSYDDLRHHANVSSVTGLPLPLPVSSSAATPSSSSSIVVTTTRRYLSSSSSSSSSLLLSTAQSRSLAQDDPPRFREVLCIIWANVKSYATAFGYKLEDSHGKPISC